MTDTTFRPPITPQSLVAQTINVPNAPTSTGAGTASRALSLVFGEVALKASQKALQKSYEKGKVRGADKAASMSVKEIQDQQNSFASQLMGTIFGSEAGARESRDNSLFATAKLNADAELATLMQNTPIGDVKSFNEGVNKIRRQNADSENTPQVRVKVADYLVAQQLKISQKITQDGIQDQAEASMLATQVSLKALNEEITEEGTANDTQRVSALTTEAEKQVALMNWMSTKQRKAFVESLVQEQLDDARYDRIWQQYAAGSLNGMVKAKKEIFSHSAELAPSPALKSKISALFADMNGRVTQARAHRADQAYALGERVEDAYKGDFLSFLKASAIIGGNPAIFGDLPNKTQYKYRAIAQNLPQIREYLTSPPSERAALLKSLTEKLPITFTENLEKYIQDAMAADPASLRYGLAGETPPTASELTKKDIELTAGVVYALSQNFNGGAAGNLLTDDQAQEIRNAFNASDMAGRAQTLEHLAALGGDKYGTRLINQVLGDDPSTAIVAQAYSASVNPNVPAGEQKAYAQAASLTLAGLAMTEASPPTTKLDTELKKSIEEFVRKDMDLRAGDAQLLSQAVAAVGYLVVARGENAEEKMSPRTKEIAKSLVRGGSEFVVDLSRMPLTRIPRVRLPVGMSKREGYLHLRKIVNSDYLVKTHGVPLEYAKDTVKRFYDGQYRLVLRGEQYAFWDPDRGGVIPSSPNGTQPLILPAR